MTSSDSHPEALRAASRQAQERFQVTVPFDTFAAFAAARASDETPLTELHLQDLYLACACLERVNGHAEAFQRHVDAAVNRALCSLQDPALASEARQLAYLQMIAPLNGRRPKLVSYSGRGGLAAWAQVVALREARALQNKATEAQPLETDALERELVPDAESVYARAEARHSFKAAFHRALSELTSQERTVLRLNVIEGLNIDEIGKLYCAHRATVARWIASTRQTLLQRTRKIVETDYGVLAEELNSLVDLLTSSFDVSLARVL